MSEKTAKTKRKEESKGTEYSLGQVWAAREAISKLVQATEARGDFPATTSLKVIKLATAMDKEIKDLQKVLAPLIDEYGTDGDKGKEVRMDNPRFEEFAEKFNPVLEEKVFLGVEHIDIPADKLSLGARSIILLQPFITVTE